VLAFSSRFVPNIYYAVKTKYVYVYLLSVYGTRCLLPGTVTHEECTLSFQYDPKTTSHREFLCLEYYSAFYVGPNFSRYRSQPCMVWWSDFLYPIVQIPRKGSDVDCLGV
jgi:hypothetical protein